MCTLGRSAAVLFLLLSAIRFVALPLARPLSLSLMSADTVQVEKAKALLLLRPSLGAAYDTLHTQALDDLRSYAASANLLDLAQTLASLHELGFLDHSQVHTIVAPRLAAPTTAPLPPPSTAASTTSSTTTTAMSSSSSRALATFDPSSFVTYVTVVLMPPPECWQPIVDIKKNHMNPRIKRPPYPHITLLSPFVRPSEFDRATAVLREAVRDIEPFEVEIPTIELFDNGKSFTLYLDPVVVDRSRADAMQQIYDRLVAAFPSGAQREFTPHIGIAFTRDRAEARRWYQQYSASWQPMRFLVKELYINSRTGQEEPFEVRRVVALGASETAPFFDEKPL